MCHHADCRLTRDGILHDPLIRLVMASDGVTPQTLLRVLDQAAAAVAARDDGLPWTPVGPTHKQGWGSAPRPAGA
jgi:hypothetical protein